MSRMTLIGAIAGLLLSTQAHAGLIGQTMTATYQTPNLGDVYGAATWTPATFTVGAGQETDGLIESVTHILTDFDDTSLTITLGTSLSSPTWNANPFNGPVFTAATPLGITAATVDPLTTMAGFDASRVSFSSDTISINWEGLSYVDGTTVKIDFAVPEPLSIAVVGTGLIGLALVRRRRA